VLKSSIKHQHRSTLVGGKPSPLKNISQLGLLFPIYGKIKNAPNHQQAILWNIGE
jgi:hypothetical protein